MPNTVLNTIVAEAFCDACDRLEESDNLVEAVHDLIKENLSEHQRVIFNGNGYSAEWVKEAERRGLPNIRSMVDSIPELLKEDTIAMFDKFHVFTKAELNSRAEVQYENYSKTINIEAKTMIDIASKQIIPAVIKYEKSLGDTINSIKNAGVSEVAVEGELLQKTSLLLTEVDKGIKNLQEVDAKACAMPEGAPQARYYHDVVMEAMNELLSPVDKLEMIVDKEMWPMPSYGDLIFEV